jgi:hypothetical protein
LAWKKLDRLHLVKAFDVVVLFNATNLIGPNNVIARFGHRLNQNYETLAAFTAKNLFSARAVATRYRFGSLPIRAVAEGASRFDNFDQRAVCPPRVIGRR